MNLMSLSSTIVEGFCSVAHYLEIACKRKKNVSISHFAKCLDLL